MARFPILPLSILVVASFLVLVDDGSSGAVRWIAVIALLAIAALLWFSAPTQAALRPSPAPEVSPATPTTKGIAVLLVEVATMEGKPLRAQDVELVKGMVEHCVRASDAVRQIYPDTIAVHLKGVTWDLADQIGCRIRDHVQDLILFDDKGLLISVVPKIGGVVSPNGEISRIEDQAKINLAEVRALNVPGLLLTPAG